MNDQCTFFWKNVVVMICVITVLSMQSFQVSVEVSLVVFSDAL